VRDSDWSAINTIRTLVIDAVQAAKSGHPGAAMALAPVGHTLWNDILRYDIADPAWPNRDRFVLSAGHASMLLYSLLHLAQVKRSAGTDELAVPLDDIKRFRQLGSVCAGHPEHGLTAGVECTTGPLSTGAGASVGMAIAGLWLAGHFNRPGFELFDYRVYAVVGDGCLMEGLGAEAASLAAHLRLDNLCWIYDSNRVTIEGPTDLAFSEDVAARFRAYGWHVTHVADANDLATLRAALTTAAAPSTAAPSTATPSTATPSTATPSTAAPSTATPSTATPITATGAGRPTLIIVQSVIGIGAPTKQGTAAAHSDPLGEEEARAAKRSYGWPEEASFLVPDEAYARFAAGVGERGRRLREEWDATLAGYRRAYPALAAELDLLTAGALPVGWDLDLPEFDPGFDPQLGPAADPIAGRDASQRVLNAVAEKVPWLLAGASDLAPSTRTRLTFDSAGDYQAANRTGRNLHFGARESAAAAAANGLALCGLRPVQAGFLVFSDFQRGPLRLSALMHLPVIHVYTHDSISMGEDGPTHQPVEHLASLRAMPGLVDLRPADATEITEAWRTSLSLSGRPVALILSKQDLPVISRRRYAPAAGLARGGYILAGASDSQPDAIIIASGSEVALAIEAHERLLAEGIEVRVVSLPSWALFAEQDQTYRDQVLPPSVTARVAVEQAATFGWERWTGDHGTIIGLTTFGASAPASQLRPHFGFTTDAITAAVRAAIERTAALTSAAQ
jgi:transketolase